jgi:hypothetical protein
MRFELEHASCVSCPVGGQFSREFVNRKAWRFLLFDLGSKALCEPHQRVGQKACQGGNERECPGPEGEGCEARAQIKGPLDL